CSYTTLFRSDAAMMIVGDLRSVTMRNHRNAVGADDPDGTVVLLGDRHGSQERVAAVVRTVDSDQNIGRWEREECSHSLTVREGIKFRERLRTLHSPACGVQRPPSKSQGWLAARELQR